MQHLTIDPRSTKAPTRDLPSSKIVPSELPDAKEIKAHPSKSGGENASLYFVGTATTILEWEGIRLMTDPNFLHAGDHVHLGPGVSATRKTNPAVDLHDLPRVDVVLLSHYHGDHFDQKVEASLRRDLPIITTPHAKSHLTSKGPEDSFTDVFELDVFQQMLIDINNEGKQHPRIRVTAMPGKHVPTKLLQTLNDIAQAIPPTNGWMVELGYGQPGATNPDFETGYRIYISGDTLMVDELKEIPQRFAGEKIDLMLIHLGGTTVPSPAMLPMAVMVTMDAKQGLELVQLIKPDLTIPIHYDDYNVFASPLEDFKKAMEEAGLGDKVVYLDRKDQYKFKVRG
ncbi:hypothetical protein DTO212C5_3450 [Paecilomyces variotii]|nr:hypothetical protein DTO212C5_3450 [Paecilomyces variotii]